MNTFLKLIAGSKNRRISFIFLAISCLSIIAAFIIGISDNRPAVFLCYVAAAALVLAFVHTWRRARYFLLLLATSFVGFFVFVVLHNLFYALGKLAAGIIVLSHLLEFLHVAFFLIAVFVCPAALLIAVLGGIVSFVIHSTKKQTP